VLNYIKAEFIYKYLLKSPLFNSNSASSARSALISLFIRASSPR